MEIQHVYHYNDVAPSDFITAHASHETPSLDRLLCHCVCRGMDSPLAPGAVSEWPGPAALHAPGAGAHSGCLLVRRPCCDCRTDAGLLRGNRHHLWESRSAAVAAALCTLARRA